MNRIIFTYLLIGVALPYGLTTAFSRLSFLHHISAEAQTSLSPSAGEAELRSYQKKVSGL